MTITTEGKRLKTRENPISINMLHLIGERTILVSRQSLRRRKSDILNESPRHGRVPQFTLCLIDYFHRFRRRCRRGLIALLADSTAAVLNPSTCPYVQGSGHRYIICVVGLAIEQCPMSNDQLWTAHEIVLVPGSGCNTLVWCCFRGTTSLSISNSENRSVTTPHRFAGINHRAKYRSHMSRTET